jgi:hypothetical protein
VDQPHPCKRSLNRGSQCLVQCLLRSRPPKREGICLFYPKCLESSAAQGILQGKKPHSCTQLVQSGVAGNLHGPPRASARLKALPCHMVYVLVCGLGPQRPGSEGVCEETWDICGWLVCLRIRSDLRVLSGLVPRWYHSIIPTLAFQHRYRA